MRILGCIIVWIILVHSGHAGGMAPAIVPGAESTAVYLPLLANKNVGIVANHSSRIKDIHLVDFLLANDIRVIRIFSPEHGFRGDADAGAVINSGKDSKTGLEIISLYGTHKKPLPGELKDIDIILFDLQDVGVRFYTYISTLHYVMEACAESGIHVVVLDRPNPNADYIDGPVLKQEFTSFVGMHPVPVVYGMTIGEYAKMINGEGWMSVETGCDLMVISCKNYSHASRYSPSLPPSPNLPNFNAIRLYPSLCFFEGTMISVGRGTDFPFQVFGHPDLETGSFYFTPESRPGAAVNPKLKGNSCRGFDLRDYCDIHDLNKINLEWLITAYRNFPRKSDFFTDYFIILSGTDKLKEQIEAGITAEEIRAGWQEDIDNFKMIRSKYLIYPDGMNN